jgi:hypothetical protein
MMRTGKSHAGRVDLTKYVKVRCGASETWRFCPVVHTGNGRIRPGYVLVDGRPELHKEGAYYIEWYIGGRRSRDSVGKNANEAFAAAERRAQVLVSSAIELQTWLGMLPLADACGSIGAKPPYRCWTNM